MTVQTATPDLSKASREAPVTFYVHVDQVKRNEMSLRGVRKDTDAYKVEILSSIIAEGQINPVRAQMFVDKDQGEKHPMVFLCEDEGPLFGQLVSMGPVEIVDGGHRLEAFCDIRKLIADGQLDPKDVNVPNADFIRVEYVGRIDEFARLSEQVQANMNSVDTTPGELAAQCARMVRLRPDLTYAQLAEKLHITPSRFGSYVKINKLDDKTQEMIQKGEIGGTNALKLTELPPSEVTEEIVAAAATASTQEFKELVNERRKELAEAKKAGAKVYTKPDPRPRKGADLIALFEAGPDEASRLGLDFDTIAWVVQQDEATLEKSKADWDERMLESKKKKFVSHAFRLIEASGLDISMDNLKGKSPAEIVALVEAQGGPRAEEGAKGLKALIESLKLGSL